MRNRILSLLNIRVSESKFVFDLLGVQFFIGISNAYVSILAFTLFINKLHIEELPQAYLVIAGALLLLNVAYEKLEHKYSPLQLLKYVISGSIIMLFLLWVGLEVGNQHLFIFLILIWSTLFYMISGYAFWGLVSLLFNVRESKRVFSVVGGGDIPAKLIGYLSAPLLIGLIGLDNLIWVSIVTLAVGLVIFNKIIKKDKWDVIRNHSSQHHEPAVRITKKEVVRFFFRNELIFAISILSILSYNVYLLVDYTFLSQVKARYQNESSLASFIATFFAIGRFISIILKLVFTSRVIERLGLISCLFITPVLLLLMCGVFFVFVDSTHYHLYVFGLMAMLTEVLRSAMQEPVFFILFQPLSEQHRLKGHIISKGYMLPFSLLTVGSTLYLLFEFKLELTIELTVKIIIVNILIWSMIIFLIRAAYKRTLHSSIRKGMFDSEDVFLFDEKSIDLLLGKVRSGNASEIIYALRLLENADFPAIDNLLSEQLENSSHSVRQYVLERFNIRGKVDNDKLYQAYIREEETIVKEKIYELLCKNDRNFLDEQISSLDYLDKPFKKILVANLLNRREFLLIKTGVGEMNRLIQSSDPDEKLLSIDIITDIRNLRFNEEVNKLINDEDPAVRRQAILGACKLKSSYLLPNVLELLDHPSEKYLAQKGLSLYGDDLYVDIHYLDKSLLEKYSSDLVKISGKVRGLHSTEFLLNQLNYELVSPDKIIHALWLKEYEQPDKNKKQILYKIMKQYLQRSMQKIDYYFGCPITVDQQLLKRSISGEVRNDLLCVLRICSMIYQRKPVNRLIELIDVEKKTKLFNAMEMMDLMLPKKLSIQLNVLFDFLLDPEHVSKRVAMISPEQLYDDIVFNNQAGFSAWTRAVCMYDSWKHSDQSVISKLPSSNFSDKAYILEETRKYVLKNVFS